MAGFFILSCSKKSELQGYLTFDEKRTFTKFSVFTFLFNKKHLKFHLDISLTHYSLDLRYNYGH